MNKIYDKLTGLDFAVVAFYLVALLVIGYIASFRNRKRKTKRFSWRAIRLIGTVLVLTCGERMLAHLLC